MNPSTAFATTPASLAEAKSLHDVIDQSERIQDTVRECASDLTSVNESIKTRLERPAQAIDVADVLEQSETIEERVHACAEELTQVNEALTAEVAEREALEEALDASRAREQAARDAALHDPLTGLPNRLLFDDRLEHGLAQARRHRRAMGVMFIDLDGFKHINDTHGHEAGDRVLQAVADRLARMTRADDTVSRVGGDEFVYLLTELKSVDDAAAIAAKLADAIATPLALDDRDAPAHRVVVRSSIGVALFPHDRTSGDALVRAADEAMYRAKRSGGGIAHATRADAATRTANDASFATSMDASTAPSTGTRWTAHA